MAFTESKDKTSILLCLLFSILLLMPYTAVGYMVMAVCALLTNIITKSKITIPGIFLSIFFIACYCFNGFFTSGANAFKDILNALAILLFVGFSPQLDTNGFNKKFIFILLCLILLSQIVVSMQIQPWVQIINDFYFDEEASGYGTVMSMSEILQGSYVRAGGFLGNPNQCAKIVNLIFAAYLVRNIRNPIYFPIWILYFLVVAYAGSRTGMLVTLALCLCFFYQKYKRKFDLGKTFCVIIGLFFSAFIVFTFFHSYFSSMRIFDIESGVDASFNVKMDVIRCYLDYLESTKGYLYALFGNFFNSNSLILLGQLENHLGFFDSDFGYIIYSYGLIGTILIVFNIIYQFKTANISYLYFILFMWMASASVLMHFKFILLFSIILRMSANTRSK